MLTAILSFVVTYTSTREKIAHDEKTKIAQYMYILSQYNHLEKHIRKYFDLW